MGWMCYKDSFPSPLQNKSLLPVSSANALLLMDLFASSNTTWFLLHRTISSNSPLPLPCYPLRQCPPFGAPLTLCKDRGHPLDPGSDTVWFAGPLGSLPTFQFQFCSESFSVNELIPELANIMNSLGSKMGLTSPRAVLVSIP